MIAIMFAVPPSLSLSADPNSCVTCHTDGEKMKSLVVPPTIHAEGEG
ncbi:MAG TPA: hypothetical protein PLR71_01105 [Deltaproteobacteria bacterium]|nr:hypothetical protein [Deltaproteobacteria bacterium]